MSKKGSIETCEISDFDEQLAVNLRAPFILTQLCVPHLIASKGNIVNVSSTVTDTHLQNGLAYGISKAGIDKLTKCCANELGLKGKCFLRLIVPSFMNFKFCEFLISPGSVGIRVNAVK